MDFTTVTYRVGQVFYPSPHYRETIASLALTPDRRALVIDTLENRRFLVPVPLAQPGREEPVGLPRLIRRLASRAKTSIA